MLATVFLVALWATVTQTATEPLRVCADPNNLLFTNAKEEGFENKIAALLARDPGTRVESASRLHASTAEEANRWR